MSGDIFRTWFVGWSLSDKIAVIASVVAFLQFLALIATVAVMRRTAQRQLRAYVGVVRGELINIDGDDPIEATVIVKNSGQTPAREVVMWGGMAVRGFPLRDPINPPEKGPPRAQTLAAGAEFYKTEKSFKTAKGEITPAHPQMLKEGTISIYVYGEITYRDVFKKKRHTTYRLFCGGGHPNSIVLRDGKTVGRLSPHEDGNEDS
jgi:hypothetical protein